MDALIHGPRFSISVFLLAGAGAMTAVLGPPGTRIDPIDALRTE